MRRTLLLLLTGCLAVISSASATLRAQSGPTPQDLPSTRPPGPRFGAHGPGGFGLGKFGPVEGCLNNGRVVANESYTGTLTYDQVEPVLNSATPIERTTTEAILRDSQGRTQRQITLPPFGGDRRPRQLICINDPVAGFGYVLDPAKMTARQFKLRQRRLGGDATTGNNEPNPRGVLPGDETNRVSGPRRNGLNANVTKLSLSPSSAPSTISKECSGAEGTQFTRTLTIPVAGNQTTSIQVVTTRWYCPAFSMNLETQTTDPLHGIATMTVMITGAGPASIAVPDGYTVIPADAENRGGRGARHEPSPVPQP